MEVKLIDKKQYQLYDGLCFDVQYALLKSHDEEENVQYGISVASLYPDGSKEEKALVEISQDKNYVLHLLMMLVENQVTPVTMSDVIEDFMV